ncbi:polysaccharide deacetylase family protein [Leifsonia shinshuensis]|uniref:Peptidoglycan/xylan/chitin deacetylase (PgdA/CDA1 family) n=1 Tax=Leifsonia shinshuensis TaxID=150026 RepID=A0A853CTT4_9MICO|nr:peptidoglycan/xylan/chitin deacetylase (PgdA/CDA1 family) [Leifsonia shinshuensis]
MIINICFHGVGTAGAEREPGESSYWIGRDLFLGVLDEVRGRPEVRLSFDDGNASDIELGLPALLERGLRATFFPIAGRLEEPGSLSPADLRTLRAAGMDIGSHGWAHIPWRRLSAPDQEREFVTARDVLAEASGGPIADAALPLGRYDRAMLNRLRGLDYRTVFSSDRYPTRESEWLQPRYSVTAGDTVATVRGFITHRPGIADLRARASSAFKRRR